MLSLFFGAKPDANLQLEKLRKFPREVGEEMDRIRSKMFVVDAHEYYSERTEGGACQIVCTSLEDGTYSLKPHGLSGTDYFFPYVSAGTESSDGKGLGHCRVPSAAPNGTIVLTGGMQGCALDIRRSGKDIIFRHDANGRSMPNPDPSEKLLVRLDAKSYWRAQDADHYSEQVMNAAPAGSGINVLHFFLSVKAEGEWVVVDSAVIKLIERVGTKKERTKYTQMPVIAHIASSFK